MESTFVLDSRVSSYVLIQPDMYLTSRLEKRCLLCNLKEIDGNCLVDSQECSLILCKVLNAPHLMNDFKKLENINYCHPCKGRILKIHESLEILKKLEKEVLEERYLIELQLETKYRVVSNELHYSGWDFGVELVNEMRFKSIKSKLRNIFKNRTYRKFCSKTKPYRIMKNITITGKLKHEMFEEHISKETTPVLYNIISTETKPFINDKLSLPSNGHSVDFVSNLQFSHAELPLTSHVYNFNEIKLEWLNVETNNATDTKDPFEGIVPGSGFVTGNSKTQNTFICGACETSFDDYKQLDEHCRTHIGSKTFCPNEFVPKVSLNTDSYTHVKELLKCKYCLEVFTDRLRLKGHERDHKGEKPFKCSYCEKLFAVPHSVKVHERIHTGEKPFKCGYCEKTFGVRSNRNVHERIHKDEKPFNCRYCDKTFRNRSYVKIHERTHAAVKPFQCKFCEKGFSQKSSTVIHERIHTKESPFKCSYCEKLFAVRHSVKVHERIHTGEKPFKCGYCEKTFGVRSNRNAHERIHVEEKPFNCGYCDKSFVDRSLMKRHERIHAAIKPFMCNYCEDSFYERSSMVLHTRTHTGEKPFKCGLCEKIFRSRHNMKLHERKHTRVNPFQCKFCEESFSRKFSMVRHERIHTNEKVCTL